MILFFIDFPKKKRVFTVIAVIIFVVAIITFLHLEFDGNVPGKKISVIENEYVSFDMNGNLIYQDKSGGNALYFAHIYESKGIADRYEEYIDIKVSDISSEDVSQFMESEGFFYDYIEGYLGGYFSGYSVEEREKSNAQIKRLNSKGILVDDEKYDYINTFVYDGETADGNSILGIMKILSASDAEWIVALMRLEDVSYEYYASTDDEKITEFRDCFESIRLSQ